MILFFNTGHSTLYIQHSQNVIITKKTEPQAKDSAFMIFYDNYENVG